MAQPVEGRALEEEVRGSKPSLGTCCVGSNPV